MLTEFFMVVYAGFWLFVASFLLAMAYRFVKAHERMADFLEKMTRTPVRDVRDPLP